MFPIYLDWNTLYFVNWYCYQYQSASKLEIILLMDSTCSDLTTDCVQLCGFTWSDYLKMAPPDRTMLLKRWGSYLNPLNIRCRFLFGSSSSDLWKLIMYNFKIILFLYKTLNVRFSYILFPQQTIGRFCLSKCQSNLHLIVLRQSIWVDLLQNQYAVIFDSNNTKICLMEDWNLMFKPCPSNSSLYKIFNIKYFSFFC